MLLAKIAIICFGQTCTLDAGLTNDYYTRLGCTRALSAQHRAADHLVNGASLVKTYCVDAEKARIVVRNEGADLELDGHIVHRMVNL